MDIKYDEKFKYECWSSIADTQHKLEKLWWRIENAEEVDEQLLCLYEQNILTIVREMQYLNTKLHHKFNNLKEDEK